MRGGLGRRLPEKKKIKIKNNKIQIDGRLPKSAINLEE
jgi:hypothetical protein